MTHLFADGGRILQTRRTEYSKHVGEPDIIEQIRHLMKSQHRAMFTALRAGEFDELIRSTLQGPTAAELEAADSPMSQRPHLRVTDMPALTLRGTDLSKPPVPSAAPVSTQAQDQQTAQASKTTESKTEPPAKQPSSRPKRPSSKPAPSTRRSGSFATAEPVVPGTFSTTNPPGLFNAPKPRPSMASNDSTRRQPNGGSIFGDNATSEQSLDDVILSYLEDDTSETPRRS